MRLSKFMLADGHGPRRLARAGKPETTRDMKVLVVRAHPLASSLNARLTDHIVGHLAKRGHEVVLKDLYDEDYDPRLSAAERARYYETPFADSSGLRKIDGLVLCFPTWWFGPPAMLKGWIDRSFLPGVAYDHHPDKAAILPRLDRLQSVLAVTTLGSPWFIDRLIMGRPVRKTLKWGVVKTCAPRARFDMLSLYNVETATENTITGFEARVTRACGRLFPDPT